MKGTQRREQRERPRTNAPVIGERKQANLVVQQYIIQTAGMAELVTFAGMVALVLPV